MKIRAAIVASALSLLAVPVAVAEGLMTTLPTVLYDAPSKEARAKIILSGGHPVRQLSFVDGWRKVQTHIGDEGWLAEAEVKPGRGVIVINEQARALAEPHPDAAAVFIAGRGVVLESLGREVNRWLQVLHQDGESGYIESSALWRNY